RPERALDSGKKYTVHVTSGVRDTVENKALDQPGASTGDHSFTASFTTFSGLVLNDNPSLETGTMIAVSGVIAISVTPDVFGHALVHTFDLSDPQTPQKIGEVVLPQRAYSVDISEETVYKTQQGVYTRVAAITTYDPLRQNTFSQVWFLNLDYP